MRRIVALLVVACLLSTLGCEVVSNCVRDTIFGGMAERYDSSRPASERRAAYDDYVREHVDR
jgi:hypothetical protein